MHPLRPQIWCLHNFRVLSASTTITKLGDGVMAVAVPWLATLLTPDPVLIGLVAADGLLIGPAILRRITPTQAIVFGMGGFSAACGVLALGPALWAVGVTLAVNGFGGMLWNIAQVSYRQRHIPAPLLGRVNSAFRFVGAGPAAFGAFAFGALIGWAEPGGAVQAVLLPYAVAAGVGAVLTV